MRLRFIISFYMLLLCLVGCSVEDPDSFSSDELYGEDVLEDYDDQTAQRDLPHQVSPDLERVMQKKNRKSEKVKGEKMRTSHAPKGVEEFTAMPKLSDEELMDLVQRQTFKYFWDYAHPVSGLAREKSGDTDRVTSGGSGFGVMALIVGVHRKYITREEAALHLLKMVRFLRDTADRHHGVWPHWLNGTTGETIRFSEDDDGGDIVETAFMIQGLLAARQAFSGESAVEVELRQIITQLWKEVEWDWYTQGQDVIYWHWSPRVGFKKNMHVRGYNECMIVYLMAIASPTHAISTQVYKQGWEHPGYQNSLNLNWPDHLGEALFLTHYSHLGMVPNFSDAHVVRAGYTSYAERNREQTLLNRRWCAENPGGFEGYGETCWGLTASLDPVRGYAAHQPSEGGDNGTISPTAAISAIIYTPEESIAAMRHFYEEHGPPWLVGRVWV